MDMCLGLCIFSLAGWFGPGWQLPSIGLLAGIPRGAIVWPQPAFGNRWWLVWDYLSGWNVCNT